MSTLGTALAALTLLAVCARIGFAYYEELTS